MHAMKPKPPSRPPTTRWSGAADWYDKHVGESGSEYHQEIVLPGTVRLLAAAPGDLALDLACGQGVLCRLLNSKGIDCTGIDASAELIQAARKRGPDSPLLRYQIGDARDLGFLPADHFNVAACVLAIQNIHPIAPVFSSAARVLKIGGRIVLVLMHPCFRGPKETRWGWDENETVQFRRVDRYLLPRKTPIVTHPGIDPGKYTWTFHKPIESYVKALRNAGLLVDAMEEWASHKKSTSGPRAGAENVAREEIPMFMAIRAVKIAMQ
jgi:ubiquinone/menaquinone biosynthesis C-methylase UbiE